MYKITDSHVHLWNTGSYEFFDRYLSQEGIDRINIVSLACMSKNDVFQNVLAACYKLLNPGKVYAFGSLMYPFYPLDRKIPKEYDFALQVKAMMDMGMDGIKMLEGKPDLRKSIGIPLDNKIYDDYYSYIEKEEIPVVFHVADPETFWDKDKAPKFSFEHGWFYGDGTFPEKETLYNEINGILTKFPRIHFIFAHFYFLSDFLLRASEFMDKWKNVSFDITPGREMYENFSKDPKGWKEFFTKYKDRIIFGTDMTDDQFQGGAADIISTMRRFLEENGRTSNWGFEIQGLGLEKDVLECIYHKNFERHTGDLPKPINKNKIVAECDRLLELTKKDREYLPAYDEIAKIREMIL